MNRSLCQKCEKNDEKVKRASEMSCFVTPRGVDSNSARLPPLPLGEGWGEGVFLWHHHRIDESWVTTYLLCELESLLIFLSNGPITSA